VSEGQVVGFVAAFAAAFSGLLALGLQVLRKR
jgi:hypothetical protein